MRPDGLRTTLQYLAVLTSLLASAVACASACPICDPAIQHFGAEQGLSHNAIVAMAQDDDGFVWLATRDGLDRLDGTSVRRFEQLGDHDLRGGNLLALATSPDGGLWIAQRDALLWRDRHGDVRARIWPRAESGRTPAVTAMVADRDGAWVGLDDGLLRTNRSLASAPTRIATVDGLPVRGLQLGAGKLLILVGEHQCTLFQLDAESTRIERQDPAPCAQGLLVDDGQLWINPDKAWQAGDPLPDQVDASRLVLRWRGGIVFADTEGAVWLAPDGGKHPWRRNNDLSSEVLAAMIDADNALWLGTYNGAFRLDPDMPAFHGLDDGALDRALGERAVSDIVRFDGRWWFASFGHGLLAWDEGMGSLSSWHDNDASPGRIALCSDYLWDLLPMDDRLVANGRCAVGNGSASIAPLSQAFDAVPRNPARDSLVDESGRIWIVNTDGLYRLVDDRAELQLAGSFETLAMTSDGSLWLAATFSPHSPPAATITGYRTTDATTRHVALPEGARIYDMQASGTRLWLATGLGLLRVDTQSGKVKHFRPHQADAGHVFYSLQKDANGNFWVGTNRGLLRFDPTASTGRQFRHYDARDGLRITEFNRRSRSVDAEGQLLLGGIGGVVRFDPARARKAAPAPIPRVTRALVWNRGGDRSVDPDADDLLSVAADDLTVALDFAAPGFRRAGHVRFRYRLDGVDADWVDASGARSARYPRLAPGDYRFRLQAGNVEAGWRDADRDLLLRFQPAWHESWLFRVPALLALLLAGWALYRWRVARLLEMERLRTRIAADLHDEMGSELAAIGMSASMLGQRDQLPADDRRRLAGVAESAQKVADAMRDIVWYVNPEKDNITALGERLQILARRLFGEDGVTVHNGWRNDDAELPMATRRELHLICREALTNARRHANASHVELRLEREAEGLRVRIIDDGQGFDPSAAADGNGLGNMARRAAAIGASLAIDSQPGQGTQVVVTLTHPRRGARQLPPLG